MQFLFDGHVLDTGRRELRLGGELVAIEPLVFDLLVYLVANRHRVVSRDDLLHAVWRGRIVSESALTTRIAAACRAVGDSGEGQRLIRTVARKGFRFIGGVRQEGAPAAPPLPPSDVTAALALPDRPSIAVLVFTNMSSDLEQEYLSDGMADDIITELSHDHSLCVIGRHSCLTYKGRAVDVKLVARELGVRYVLTGSIRRNDGQIRVNAQLIEAETGNHIWADRYDRVTEAVFAVQDEIATAVVRAIHPAISHAERQRAIQKPPESLNAWIELDRRSAFAHSMAAWAFGHQGDWGPALEEAEIAIGLNPNDPWGYLSKGHNLMYAGRSAEAREPLAIALRLDPRGPMALTVQHQCAVAPLF